MTLLEWQTQMPVYDDRPRALLEWQTQMSLLG